MILWRMILLLLLWIRSFKRKARQAIFKNANFNRNPPRFNRIYRFYGSSHTYRQNCDRIAIAYPI